MDLHPDKSLFFAINAEDLSPFVLDHGVLVKFSDIYGYLGTPVSNNSVANQVRDHMKSKCRDVTKFSAFLSKHPDAPYSVKKTVWNSAVVSAILYSCETWLTKDLSCASSLYRRTVKELLGVRQSTATNIIIVEAGIPDAKPFILSRQIAFMNKLRSSPSYPGSPVHKAITLAATHQSPMGKYIQYLDTLTLDPLSQSIEDARSHIASSDSSRCLAYASMNPSLSVHPMYSTASVLEHARIATTRLRTTSHSLKVETGRWARIERENRRCLCGAVQDEAHVLLQCPHTAQLRNSYAEKLNLSDISNLMDSSDPYYLSIYCFKVLVLIYDL